MVDYSDLLSNEKYDVSNYLIKNPSVVVGLFTAASAIVLVLMYSASYLQDASILEFWNVPKDFIDLSGKTKVYKIGLTILTTILLPIINNYSSHYFSVINKSMNPLAVYNTILSNEHVSSFSKKEISITEIRRNELIKSIKTSLLYLLIPLTFFILLYITLQIYYLSIKAILIIVFGIPAIWFLSSAFLLYYNYRKARKRYDNVITYDDVLEISFPYSFGFIKKNMVSNQSILIYFSLLIMFTLLFFSLLVGIGTYEAKHPLQFEVVDNKNSSSVIVYKASNYAVLEQCRIDDNKIIIDVSSQEIVSYDSLNYRICKYDSFERVNLPANP